MRDTPIIRMNSKSRRRGARYVSLMPRKLSRGKRGSELHRGSYEVG